MLCMLTSRPCPLSKPVSPDVRFSPVTTGGPDPYGKKLQIYNDKDTVLFLIGNEAYYPRYGSGRKQPLLIHKTYFPAKRFTLRRRTTTKTRCSHRKGSRTPIDFTANITTFVIDRRVCRPGLTYTV